MQINLLLFKQLLSSLLPSLHLHLSINLYARC